MSVQLPQGFNIRSTESIDKRIVLTKAEMLSMNVNIMPQTYFAVCKDDSKLYIFDKANELDPITGKFRLYTTDAQILSEPSWDANLNTLFANGTAITITSDTEKNIATYYGAGSSKDEPCTIEFPFNAIVVGGGNGNSEAKYFEATKIIINGGTLTYVYGGNLGAGLVGSTTIIQNGGTVYDGIYGGSCENATTLTQSNLVGNVNIELNGGSCLGILAGSGKGLTSVGKTKIILNDGVVSKLYPSASIGTVGIAEVEITGGIVTEAASVESGYVSCVKWLINGGRIINLFAATNGTTNCIGNIEKTIMKLFGGKIDTVNAGTVKATHDAYTRCQGEYDNNIVTTLNTNCNLTERVLILSSN